MSRTVLVIDDDEDLCAEIRDILLDEGFEVLTAHDGAAGKDILEKRSVGLLLLDLKIPRISGYRLLSFLKDRMPELKVIVLSGRPVRSGLARHDPNFRDKEEDLLNSADAFLNKPYDVELLLSKINSLIPSERR